jgi:hypothetical protein
MADLRANKATAGKHRGFPDVASGDEGVEKVCFHHPRWRPFRTASVPEGVEKVRAVRGVPSSA